MDASGGQSSENVDAIADMQRYMSGREARIIERQKASLINVASSTPFVG